MYVLIVTTSITAVRCSIAAAAVTVVNTAAKAPATARETGRVRFALKYTSKAIIKKSTDILSISGHIAWSVIHIGRYPLIFCMTI